MIATPTRGRERPGPTPTPTPSGPRRATRRRDRAARALRSAARLATSGLLLSLAGCASLGIGKQQEGGEASEAAAARDSVPPSADTLARADTLPSPSAVADSGASLRDSVLSVMRSRRAAGDSAAGDDGNPAATPKKAAPDGKESEDEVPTGPIRITDVDSLAALGPVYTPYDVPPVLQRTGLDNLLRATILPAIQRHDLEPDEWARFWVLVDREGRVVDRVLHLTSGHAAFDDAAAAAAGQLRYRPARRGEKRVPVWVLVRISLLMG